MKRRLMVWLITHPRARVLVARSVYRPLLRLAISLDTAALRLNTVREGLDSVLGEIEEVAGWENLADIPRESGL